MALRTYTVAEAAVIAMLGSITYFLFLHPLIPDDLHLPIGPWRTPIERAEGPAGRVVGLTRNGDLFVVSLKDGRVEASHDVGNSAHHWFSSSLVASADGNEVFAAVVDSATRHTKVVALDRKTLTIREVLTIGDSLGYPWIDVGPKSGRLYLFAENGIRVVVADRSGRILRRDSVMLDSLYDGRALRARISPDERRAYFSFGTWIDWVELRDDGLVHCNARSPDGCTVRGPYHDFDFFRGNLVTATGALELAELDDTGTLVRTHPIGGLEYTRVLRLAVDSATGFGYVLGTRCFSKLGWGPGRGPAVVPLGAPNDTSWSFPDQACGFRVAAPPHRGWLAVAETGGGIVIFDAKRGERLGRIRTPGEVQSLVVID